MPPYCCVKLKAYFCTRYSENYLTFDLISACSNPPVKFLNGFLYDSHFSHLSFMYKSTQTQTILLYLCTVLCLPSYELDFFMDFITNDSRIFFSNFHKNA